MHFKQRIHSVKYFLSFPRSQRRLVRALCQTAINHHLISLLVIGILLVNPVTAYAKTLCGKIYKGSFSDFTAHAPTDLPEWWENNLGTDDVILPGYSPVRAVDNTVQLYQREYKWKKSHFPRTIKSRGSILAEGMRLVAQVNGKLIEFSPDTIKMVQNSDTSVDIFTTGEPLPGLKVSIETHVEYDGVAISRIQLTPSRAIKLESLTYDVLVKDSPSMEVISFKAGGIRKQKDRHDTVKLPYAGEFLNVIGFADGNRSFWWFADNAKGWIWNSPIITEVARTNGGIQLRQRLIGNPWTIKEAMTFNVNFLATPVKNLGSNWRSKRIIYGVPRKQHTPLGGTFKLWWTNAFAHDAFPYTYIPTKIKDRVTPEDASAFPGLESNTRTIKIDKTKYGAHWIPYFSAHALSKLDPALELFKPYWEIHPPKQFNEVVRPYKKIYGKPVLTHRAKSYSNYLLWRLNEEIDRMGIEGIYLDHGPPHDSCNPKNGGWIDSNGRLQPSLDILGLRDFLKRLHVLFISKGKAGYIFIHSSNREIIPAYTFAYSTVDGEQYRNGRVRNGDYLSAVSLDEFRTRFSTYQYGLLTTWLPSEWTYHKDNKRWNGSEQQRGAYRRLMSLALLHDIPDWPMGSHKEERDALIETLDRFGINKAEFIGYWHPQIAVKADDPGVKISAYLQRDAGKYLFIAANTSDRPIDSVLTFDLSQLGLSEVGGRLFVEKKQASELTPDNVNYNIQLPAKDFRWLWVKRAQ